MLVAPVEVLPRFRRSLGVLVRLIACFAEQSAEAALSSLCGASGYLDLSGLRRWVLGLSELFGLARGSPKVLALELVLRWRMRGDSVLVGARTMMTLRQLSSTCSKAPPDLGLTA